MAANKTQDARVQLVKSKGLDFSGSQVTTAVSTTPPSSSDSSQKYFFNRPNINHHEISDLFKRFTDDFAKKTNKKTSNVQTNMNNVTKPVSSTIQYNPSVDSLYSRFHKVTFGMESSQVIKNYAAAEVKHQNLFTQTKYVPVNSRERRLFLDGKQLPDVTIPDFPGGVSDGNMGTGDPNVSCKNCRGAFCTCRGHPGFADMLLPMLHPAQQFIDTESKQMSVICPHCRRVPIPDATKKKLMLIKDKKKRLAKVCEELENARYCGELHDILEFELIGDRSKRSTRKHRRKIRFALKYANDMKIAKGNTKNVEVKKKPKAVTSKKSKKTKKRKHRDVRKTKKHKKNKRRKIQDIDDPDGFDPSSDSGDDDEKSDADTEDILKGSDIDDDDLNESKKALSDETEQNAEDNDATANVNDDDNVESNYQFGDNNSEEDENGNDTLDTLDPYEEDEEDANGGSSEENEDGTKKRKKKSLSKKRKKNGVKVAPRT